MDNPDASLPLWFRTTLSEESFRERISSPVYRNYLYMESGEIRGYIALKGDGHLFHLFVSEESQGKGIARKLWQHILTQCPYPKYTLRSSLHAVPIYKKFGFKESAQVGVKDGIGFQPMAFSMKC